MRITRPAQRPRGGLTVERVSHNDIQPSISNGVGDGTYVGDNWHLVSCRDNDGDSQRSVCLASYRVCFERNWPGTSLRVSRPAYEAQKLSREIAT